MLFAGCAQTVLTPTHAVYFVKPSITYLREQPDLASKPVIGVYKGDQLESLEGDENAWIKVKSARKEMIGWIPSNLVTRNQIEKEIYYVNKETVPVHHSPGSDSPTIKSLAFGSKVQKIEELPYGWWRILEEDAGLFGWVLAESFDARPPVHPKLTQIDSKSCFVAGNRVNLYKLPLRDSQVIKVLALNDKAEILARKGDWSKIKVMETGAEGWVVSKLLEPKPVEAQDRKNYKRQRKRPTEKSKPSHPAEPKLKFEIM